MRYSAKIYAGAFVIAVGGIGIGATLASAAGKGPAPVQQPAGQYVFACVNAKGQIDYLEFRKPLPHQCSKSGESLWHWAIAPATVPSDSPSPSPSDSPTPTPTASPTDASSPTPSPQGSWGLGDPVPSPGN